MGGRHEYHRLAVVPDDDFLMTRWLFAATSFRGTFEEKIEISEARSMHSHINEEVARLFLERQDPEILNKATGIDEEAATLLAGHRGPLDLSGLRSVSYDVAICFRNHVGELLLNGIEVLTDGDDAGALASNQGDLHLEGLEYLSEEAADGLSDSEWTLRFNPDLAGSLCSGSQYSLTRQISRVTLKQIGAGLPLQLTEFARELLKSDGGFVFRLPDLTESLARTLAAIDFDLKIDGMKNLSDEAAAELSRHKGRLSLNDLVKISDSAARHLANHEGPLSLDGIKRLSKTASRILFRRNFPDSFDGLQTLPPKIAARLAKSERYWLFLSRVKSLSADSAKELARSTGYVELNGLKKLSPSAAKAFASHKGRLALGGICEISVPLARALALHKGDLSLGGLKEISVEVAEALAPCRGALNLDGLEELTAEVAEVLARRKHPLSVDGLTSLSDSAARALANFQGHLSCEGLLKKAPEVAALLIKGDGEVEIDTKYSVGSYGVFPIVFKYFEGAYYYDGGDFSAGPFPSFDEAVDALESDIGTTDGGLFDHESDAEDHMNGSDSEW